MSPHATRITGLYAAIAAGAAIIVSPLLALSYFATEDGASELEVGSVSAWAEPARDLVDGLVTFASPDNVYFVYLKALMLIAPALVLCAFAVKSRRPESLSGTERWGWRIALVGYALLAIGVTVIFPGILEVAFFAFVVPGLLLGTIGSTVLGIALIRSSYRPRLTAWLLVLGVPLWLVGSDVLGHNSLGIVPLFVAWGVTGWRLWRSEPVAPLSAEAGSVA